MKKNYLGYIILFCSFFYLLFANSLFANNTDSINSYRTAKSLFFKNSDKNSFFKINGNVFPITINPLTIPNLKVNQTADYTFSYLVSNTKNIPAKSYVWVDFDNNGIYAIDEAVVTTIPANTNNFKVNVNYLNANFINKLVVGSLNIKFTTTTTTLVDDNLTPNIDERSTSLGIDGETEMFSEKNISGVNVSGSVFADGNGINDNLIFGTGVGIIEGTPLQAYLLDNTNTVILKTVFSLGGSYKFENLYKGTYTIAVSLNNYPLGTPIGSIVSNLPVGWNLAGETYGSIGNLPLGIEPGTPNLQIPITTQTAPGGTDIFGVNFAVNRTPVATNDVIETNINTPIDDYNLTANDTDPDGNLSIDKTSILLIDPQDGLKKTTVNLPNKGEYKVDATGKVSFVPVINFLGVAPVISYTVKDKAGIESNVGFINLVVKPVGVNDIKVIDTPVSSITINILTNDGISGVLAAPAETVENPQNATVVANANGDITFVFPPNQIVPNTYVYTYVLKTADGVFSDPITATIVVAYSPTISLTKTPVFNDTNNDGLAQAGEIISYSFKVTNSGNVDVTNVAISDPKINLVNAAVLPNPLKPGETGLLTIVPNNYTITPADILAGEVLNTATATAFEPVTNKTVNASADTIVIFPILKIKLVKTSKIIDTNNNGVADVGDIIEYTFTVTNTGTVSVANLSISDPKIGLVGEAITPATLLPGEVGILTSASSYTITQADVTKGFVSNKATAKGINVQNTAVSAESENGNPTTVTDPACPTCTITELPKVARISLVKTAKFRNVVGDNTAQLGDIIDYFFTVTNTGNVNVNNLTITDAKLNLLNVALSPSTLAPGATSTLANASTAYIITQADIDAGRITNSAEAKGLDPNNVEVTDISGTTNTNNLPTVYTFAAISLLKSSYIIDVNNNGFADVGDKIDYTFTLTNTGSVVLTNIVVSDLGATITGGPLASLTPNQVDSTTFKASYIITQQDVNKGFVYNTANVVAKDPSNQDVNAASSNGNPTKPTDVVNPTCPTCTITPILKTAQIALEKTAQFVDSNNDSLVQVGESIQYTFTVTNTGNVDIKNIVINDTKLNLVNATIIPVILTPNAIAVFSNATTKYTISQADIDAGLVSNTAEAKGFDPNNIEVKDVSGTSKINNDPTVFKFASLSLVKTSNIFDVNANGYTDAGDKINYVFTVKNTGVLQLTNITVADLNASISGGPIPSLTPNQVDNTTFTASYIITQADVDKGFVYNTATAIASSPGKIDDVTATSTNGNPAKPTDIIDPTCPTCTITEIIKKSEISLVKTAVLNDNNANTFAEAGETVTYTFTVKNTGNVNVNNLTISDVMLGMVNVPLIPQSLMPLETATYNFKYVLTQANIDAGQLSNTAVANGVDTSNKPVTDISGTGINNNTPTVIVFVKTPKISLVKSSTIIDVNNNSLNDVGDIINYIFSVKNTGNVSLTNITLTDAKVLVKGGPIALLNPQATDNATFTAVYTITQADVDKGFVYNTATATGSSPGNTNDVTTASTNGNPAKPTDVIDPTCPTCTITPFEQKGKIALIKKVTNTGTGVNGTFLQGDIIKYLFTITNTGNLTLTNLVLTDPLFVIQNIALPITTLLPKASIIAKGEYKIAAADILVGKVDNQALVTSLDPKNNLVEDKSGSDSNANDKTTTQLATPPVAANDNTSVKQNSEVIIYILNNDSSPTSAINLSTIEITVAPVNGTAIINANGTIKYTPKQGFIGSDVFTYRFKDSNLLQSNAAVVSITVVKTNPVAVDDETKTEISKEVKINIIANDIPDGSPLNPNSVEFTTPPNGSVIDNKDGTFTYIPKPDFVGVDTFTYTIKDGNGNKTNTATVKIKVDGIFIPNVFTPNGDGVNDTFEIIGYANYSNVEIEVFNRWGNQVYKNLNYTNQWFADGLNEGTYYYIIKLKNLTETKTIKGWVLIKR